MFGFGKTGWVEWFKLGVSYEEAGKFDKAVNAFHQVLLANPNHFGAWINLGLLYVQTRQFAKATEALQHTLCDFIFGYRIRG